MVNQWFFFRRLLAVIRKPLPKISRPAPADHSLNIKTSTKYFWSSINQPHGCAKVEGLNFSCKFECSSVEN